MVGIPMTLAFEWPQGCDGWKEPLVSELLHHFPISCSFNGCRYGLRSGDGRPMCKPWTVRTNLDRLKKPLTRRCRHNHQH
eukprot:6684322-Heterocapsa_arctica.AAC.1